MSLVGVARLINRVKVYIRIIRDEVGGSRRRRRRRGDVHQIWCLGERLRVGISFGGGRERGRAVLLKTRRQRSVRSTSDILQRHRSRFAPHDHSMPLKSLPLLSYSGRRVEVNHRERNIKRPFGNDNDRIQYPAAMLVRSGPRNHTVPLKSLSQLLYRRESRQ